MKKSFVFFGVFLMSLFADETQVDESKDTQDIVKVRLEKSSVSTGALLESDVAKIPGSITTIDSAHIQKNAKYKGC